MLSILQNPIWQFIGAVLGFVALVATVFIFLLQRKRKILLYESISAPLLSWKEEVKESLKISFKGKLVQDVHLIWITFTHGGNVPIVPDDYELPISISFGRETQILAAEVAVTEPNNPQASASIEGTRVVLSKVLLNEGDRITVKILINHESDFIVAGRIVGVKEIQKFRGSRQALGKLAALGVLTLMTIGLISFSWGTFLVVASLMNTGESLLGPFLIVFGFLLVPVTGYLARQVLFELGRSSLLFPARQSGEAPLFSIASIIRRS